MTGTALAEVFDPDGWARSALAPGAVTQLDDRGPEQIGACLRALVDELGRQLGTDLTADSILTTADLDVAVRHRSVAAVFTASVDDAERRDAAALFAAAARDDGHGVLALAWGEAIAANPAAAVLAMLDVARRLAPELADPDTADRATRLARAAGRRSERIAAVNRWAPVLDRDDPTDSI